MDDLSFLAEHYDKELIDRIRFVIEKPFMRITYTEGVQVLEQAVKDGQKFEFPVYWGADLASEHERRSEEHTSELQSRQYLVCRLLLEKKKKKQDKQHRTNNCATFIKSV